MPVSSYEPDEDIRVAVAAQSLYLVNLLLLPGLAFIVLVLLYYWQRQSGTPFSLFHIKQTLSASLWAGMLLVGANLLILFSGGYDGPYTWMIVIVYFTMAHSTLIIFGMIGLVKALAGQRWSYPLIGNLLG